MTHLPLPERINLDDVLAHSYRDFHVKGFDYICLRRSPVETWKLYFFEGAVEKASEVVHPHDHRYDFDTFVIRGAVQNVLYEVSDSAQGAPYNRFDWRTPLNPGPSGFVFADSCSLKETSRTQYEWDLGSSYSMAYSAIHTIRIMSPGTILLLKQYEDRVPVGAPTSTYSREEAPTTNGCYNRFTKDNLLAKLRNFEDRTSIRFQTMNGEGS